MRRREFITLVGGAVAAWPLAARGQQATIPIVGFLGATSETQWRPLLADLLQGLKDAGYVEGRNVSIKYRWADGRYDRLPELAADLARDSISAIVASSAPAAFAAKAATSEIPIVFVSGIDPVALGLVSSISRPGGNITGVNFVTAELTTKIVEITCQLLPHVGVIGLLINPKNPNSATQVKDARAAAQNRAREILVLNASSESEIDAALNQAGERGAGAVVVTTDAFFLDRKDQLVDLSRRLSIATVYNIREYVASGGLLSYGTSLSDAYRQVGRYVGRVLRGQRPADLPIVQPTRFELVINRKTAKALGIEVPDNLLALADEVIE